MKLIAGLGNPGRQYKHNRHNIGFQCIDHFARLHSIAFNKNQCQSRVGSGEIDGVKIVLAKPKTFMNESGRAVSLLLRKYKIPVHELLVIYDDMDLPLGKLRLKHGGSSGGHKGINSILSSLGHKNFHRIRLGIGHPLREKKLAWDNDIVIEYVLSDFNRDESEIVSTVIERAAEAIQCVLLEGIESAMNKYNA
jgi:PTH1 family peptidyl-tRNA hydrolase